VLDGSMIQANTITAGHLMANELGGLAGRLHEAAFMERLTDDSFITKWRKQYLSACHAK